MPVPAGLPTLLLWYSVLSLRSCVNLGLFEIVPVSGASTYGSWVPLLSIGNIQNPDSDRLIPLHILSIRIIADVTVAITDGFDVLL